MREKVVRMQYRDEVINRLAGREQLEKDANLSLDDRVKCETERNP